VRPPTWLAPSNWTVFDPARWDHEPPQVRVDGAVGARNCVPQRKSVPGARPGWAAEEDEQARRALLGWYLGGQLRIQVLGEVLGEVLRVDDDEGERGGEYQVCQKRPGV
jgi:hypothetical protein